MPRLALYLLGPPRIERDGVVLKLDRRKSLALLAYLAVTGQSHRRDSLVNLLWPDYSTAQGRAALRRTLHALNSSLGGDWLDVDREEIGLTPGTEMWVDVVQFRRGLADCEKHGHPSVEVCSACVAPLAAAVELAHGEFLSGFGLKDSDNFDDWQMFQAEALRKALGEALSRLVHWHSTQREFEPAIGYARRRLALDALDEAAHRELMRLYAWSGRRPAALRQYEECVATLGEQLGVPPQDATRLLYEEIQDGRPPPLPAVVDSTGEPPSFLRADGEVERPVFVARERELAQLEGFLNLALAGQGRVAFVTGEAGCGKTALLQEFIHRALETHAGVVRDAPELRLSQGDGTLVVATGNCNAYTGIGDPYLPFREILALVTGDVEARWVAGAMTRGHVLRLWHTLPLAAQALVEAGPDLLDVFVSRGALLERAMAHGPTGAEWLARLEQPLERRTIGPGVPGAQQSDLFDQYSRVLQLLARQVPLVLVVDDLQWADLGSISLLFHLGRHVAGQRILIVGAYRPEEVAIGREGERHPLEPVVNEFQRSLGHITVDLDQAKSKDFVDALLDSEPNRLGVGFRAMLHRQTRGHPLFTIELLRGLQERGDLVQDPAGRWVEGPALNPEALPARVEAAIRERLGRLPEPLQAALRVASVEGEVFTVEVMTRVLGGDERSMVKCLSSELDRRHRLVQAQAIERVEGQRVARYRFRNYLFQKYLYDSLDEVERAYLHEDVGRVLEELYGDRAGEIAVQLAWHFQEAGIAERAIHYLHRAALTAVHLSAYREAVTHLTRGLDLLMARADTPERARQELELRLTLGWASIGSGRFTPEAGIDFARARELGQQTGQTAELCQALAEMAIFHYVRAEHRLGRDLAEEAVSLAQRAEDPLLVAWSQWHLGFTLFGLGEFAAALDHMEQVMAFYATKPGLSSFPRLPSADAGCSSMAYAACCLWCLGYPEQAQQRSDQALALARDLGDRFTLADVLVYGGCLFDAMRRDAHALEAHAAELNRIAGDIPSWSGPASWHKGDAAALLGQVEAGIVLIRAGITLQRAEGAGCEIPHALSALAQAQARAGRLQEGLATLAEALRLVEDTGERYWEVGLHWLKAELLLMQGDQVEAEASLHRAVEVARGQSARSWELRATTSLARLWQAQGRSDEACRMLAEIYGWFTEGFDTPDMKEAKALLEELSLPPRVGTPL